MHPLNHAGLAWKKSSRSAGNGNCVEVARVRSHAFGVRDSKDNAAGPVLVFGPGAWDGFLNQVKAGKHDI